jgi:hypothetical protein
MHSYLHKNFILAKSGCYRGGAGRSDIGEERAAAVVRHNGDEGGRFGRGSARE